MIKDALGDRMKEYESIEAMRRFMPRLPIIARLDGRGFSRFTKGMERPYDRRMSEAMIATTAFLVEHTHAVVGYTQSDEISLAWYSDDPKSQVWFDGRIQKMTSQLAAQASVVFYREVLKRLPAYAERIPTFDARVWNVPTLEDAADAFLWRERDATKNSVSMAASAYYSHDQLMNKTSSEKHDMLIAEGINWNDYPAFFKRGTFLQRQAFERHLAEEELRDLPPKHHMRANPDQTVTRACVVEIHMPIFDKVINRIEVLFNGAKPQVEEIIN